MGFQQYARKLNAAVANATFRTRLRRSRQPKGSVPSPDVLHFE